MTDAEMSLIQGCIDAIFKRITAAEGNNKKEAALLWKLQKHLAGASVAMSEYTALTKEL